MPSFSEYSKRNLSSTHWGIQKVANHAIGIFDFRVTCGFRGKAAQDQAFMEGKSQKQFPGSMHNRYLDLNANPPLGEDPDPDNPDPKMHSAPAFDFVPYPVDWNDRDRAYHLAGIIIGVADTMYRMGEIPYRLRWGGNWDSDSILTDQSFFDLWHFEVRLADL